MSCDFRLDFRHSFLWTRVAYEFSLASPRKIYLRLGSFFRPILELCGKSMYISLYAHLTPYTFSIGGSILIRTKRYTPDTGCFSVSCKYTIFGFLVHGEFFFFYFKARIKLSLAKFLKIISFYRF